MLASMIFQKEPFFHGQDNYDQVPLTFDLPEPNSSSNSVFMFHFDAVCRGYAKSYL